MNFKKIKLELFYLRKSFLGYKKGFKYLVNRYFLALNILKAEKIFERPINNQDLSIHVLSCHRDLVMLVWSLASFYLASEIIGQLYIHSDGSLNSQDQALLKKFFPSAAIITPESFTEKYLASLERYPIINKFRIEYPQFFLLKKIIDPYFVSDKNLHLIIDSDLLWFKNSDIIEREVGSQEAVKKSLMIAGQVDSGEPNYVYFKDGNRLDDKLASLNSGIVFYQKQNFDLAKLVDYFQLLDITNSKNLHFIEQAGYAYCLKNLVGLLSGNYQIGQAVNSDTIVRHYTSPKRPLFFIEGIEILRDKILV